jgi:PBP1b-binding outer membrane lipoprotein LpoB
MMKTITMFYMLLVLTAVLFTGCGSSNNTVETCVVSTEQYTEKAALESASQPESFKTGQDIFASVRFIESPLGMKYTGKWYIDDAEIKTEEKETATDKSDIIIYSLPSHEVTAGTLRFEILYGDDVLYTKELPVW